jgi:Fe-Mn family superoxide dismutase
MPFTLPPLPYPINALVPHLSEETLIFHHGKHHNAYVTKLNELVAGKPEEKKTLEELILTTTGPVFNQAAQIWNHTFYWNSLSPTGGGEPKGKLGEAITKQWGSFDKFKEEFTAKTVGVFGSGWGWLVKKEDGSLEIVGTSNAGNPMTDKKKPLLTCDVWEHAYYIDFRNLRPKYLETFWKIVNWDFAEKNFG